MYVNICVHRNMNYLRSFRRSGLKTLVIVNQMQGTRSGALEKDCLSTGFPTTNNGAKLVYEKSTSSGSVLWVASRWKNVSYEEVIRTFYNVPGPEGGFSKSRRERGVNCSVEKEPDCHGFVIKHRSVLETRTYTTFRRPPWQFGQRYISQCRIGHVSCFTAKM